MTTPATRPSLSRMLMPLIFAESVALIACVLAFVMTQEMIWVYAAVVVAAASGALFAWTIVRHRRGGEEADDA